MFSNQKEESDMQPKAMNQKLVQLIDEDKYFGPDGAITYSKFLLEACKPYESTETKIDDIMIHLNVLYSAMTWCANGNVFMKIRALYLAYMCDYFATLVLDQSSKVHNLAKILGAGGCHVLMSVWVRALQILKKLQLHDQAPSLRSRLYDKMITSYNMIAVIANEEPEYYVPKHMYDFGPASRLQLLGIGLLFELSTEDLYRFPQVNEESMTREHIWRYCTWHDPRINDRAMIQLVCRLYRSIGHHKLAEGLERRGGTNDQLEKAMA